jgi:hypothetical protein
MDIDNLIKELKKNFTYLDTNIFKQKYINYYPLIYTNIYSDTTSLKSEIAKNIKKKTVSKKYTTSENIVVPEKYNNFPNLNQILNKYILNNNQKNFILTELCYQRKRIDKEPYNKFKFVKNFPINCQVCHSNIIISFDNDSNYKIECENDKNHKNVLIYTV